MRDMHALWRHARTLVIAHSITRMREMHALWQAQMTRVTRVLNANTVLAGAYGGGGSPAGGGEETSSSNPKRLDAANRFSKQTLEQFYLYNDLM
jgi:hypothetical protein